MSKRHEEIDRMPSRLWTLQETAAFLGLPVATMYQLNYKGTGPRYYPVGRHCRYEPEEVMAWLRERRSDRHAHT
jgi:predicted DNA-binding transcriptional regulator AlpA